MRNLDILGQKYCDNLMEPKFPESNWWAGLDFFFGRVFNRGRRDELSLQYMTLTKEVLSTLYEIKNGNFEKSYQLLVDDFDKGYFDKDIILNFKKKHGMDKRANSVKHEDFVLEISRKNHVIKALTSSHKIEVDYKIPGKPKKLEDVRLGNEKDILMVLDTLSFIASKKPNNIYYYIRNAIQNKGVDYTYDLLTGISQIGDKLGAFVIRDIILMDPTLIDGEKVDYEKMFPVDTWVSQIYKKMNKIEGEVKKEQIKQYYIEKSISHGYSPPKIAAGLWYLSSISLDLLIANLDRIIV